jgi:hypothetical protein
VSQIQERHPKTALNPTYAGDVAVARLWRFCFSVPLDQQSFGRAVEQDNAPPLPWRFVEQEAPGAAHRRG